MRRDTQCENNVKKTITSLCLIGNWRVSHLSSALRVKWNEKMKDKPDLNRPTIPYVKNRINIKKFEEDIITCKLGTVGLSFSQTTVIFKFFNLS